MSEKHILDTPFIIHKFSTSNNKICNKCGLLQYHSLVFCPNCVGKFMLNKTMTWRTLIKNNVKHSDSCISIYHCFLYFKAFNIEPWNDKERKPYSDLPEPFLSYFKDGDDLYEKHGGKLYRRIVK